MITARPSYITRIFAELVRNSRRTGTQRNAPLKGGAELAVLVRDGTITLTIKRPNVARFMALGSYKSRLIGGIIRGQIRCSGRTANTPERGQQPIREVPAMATIASPRFYVYVLCRPDGKPFYVGKGSGARVFAHDTEARSGHRCHKCNTIRKIWRQGGTVQRYIMLETDNEQEAFAYEVELIALHGRSNLTNLTDGGEGASGNVQSQASRAKKRLKMLKHSKTEAFRIQIAKMSALAAVRYRSPAEREGMRARAKARFGTAEAREATRQRNLANNADPEWREQFLARARDPEERARNSARQKARLSDPIEAAKFAEVRAKRWIDPAQRAALSERSKALWQDPEYRAKRHAAAVSGWAKRRQTTTPEEH